MTDMNSVTLVGHLTRDPELRFTGGGVAVVSFGVAWNRRYQQNGDWKSEVSYFNVSAWAQLAENIAASLSKGDRVVVTGQLRSRSYEAQDGSKRTVNEIAAEAVGPDLRFATVQVERTERTDRSSRPPDRPADPVYSDEEPFVSLYRGHQSYRNLHAEPGF